MRLSRSIVALVWRIAVVALVTACLFIIFAQKTRAVGPNLISFQGKVVNADGTNVTNGAYNFDFILWDDPTAGTNRWQELTKSITVTNGVFQTNLGSATALPDFNAFPNLYLAVRFNADAAGYMSPRVRMTSVPYALNADKLEGLASSAFAQLGLASQTFTGTNTFTPTSTNNLIFNGDNDSNLQINSTISSDVTQNGLTFTLTNNAAASTGTLFGLSITNADNGANVGVPDAIAYFRNANAAETVPSGILVEQTGAGTLSSGIEIKRTAGTVTNGLTFTGTFGTNLISAPNFSVSNAGAIVGVGVNSGSGLIQGTGGLTVTGTTNINATGTAATNLGNSTGALTVNFSSATFTIAAGTTGFTVSGLDADSTVTLSGLNSCDTIDTTATGVLVCGTDAGGAGASPFGVAAGLITKNTGTDQLKLTMAEAGDYGLLVDASVAPTADLVQITNAGFGATITAIDGLQINFVTAAVAGSVDNAGLRLVINPIGATEAGDTVEAIDIANITNPTGVTTALKIGTGWDTAINVGSGDIITSNLGIDFTESDTNPTCAAGDYKIYADLSEGNLKRCKNGTVYDLAQDSDLYNKSKSADQSVNNSIVLVDETALQFPIGATEEWNIIWNLIVSNTNNVGQDWKSAVVGPAANTCTAVLSGSEPTGSAFPQVTTTDCIEAPGTLVNGVIAADANIPFNVNMIANVTGGGTAGTVKMQFAHSTATAANLTIKAGSIMNAYKVTGADLAEVYYSKDETIIAGDVVSLDSSISAGVKKTGKKYDGETIGVISTKPGLVLSDASNNDGGLPVFVALAGRVPVKVVTENGAIKPGDYLTSSSIPGVAMKATKAGRIIGQAMTAYDGEGLGMVKIFINNSYSQGSKLADLLPGVTADGADSTHAQFDIAKVALAQFVDQREELAQSVDLSEIVTDRVSAGLEVITPNLIADKVNANSIEAASGIDIRLKLGEGGKFIVPNGAGEDVITFDALGNAIFAGTVTANKIKANQIEGLEILTDRISSLQNQFAKEKAASPATPTTNTEPTPDQALLSEANISSSTGVSLVILAQIESRGGLIVDKDAQFNGKTIFALLAEFNGPANFNDQVTFNNDAGGAVVIKNGARKVSVSFSKEYSQAPIVVANWSFADTKDASGDVTDSSEDKQQRLLEGSFSYLVANVSVKGFDIIINKNATEDLTLNWLAVSIKDAKISQSQ